MGCGWLRLSAHGQRLAFLANMADSHRDESRANSHRADGDYQPVAISHLQELEVGYAAIPDGDGRARGSRFGHISVVHSSAMLLTQ